MTNKDNIKSFYNSFYSLIKVIKKKIDFDEVEQWKLKGVLEGRNEAFLVARSQLNTIKELQSQDNIWEVERYKTDTQKLINSTSTVIRQVKKVLDMDIYVDEIEEEKFKSVVHSKRVAGEFLLNISSLKEDMEFQLANNSSEIKRTSKNIATDRVKKRK